MEKQQPLSGLIGFARFKRSQITKDFEWHRNGYWMHKIDKDFRREPGKFCGDCVTVELTKVRKSRNISAHLTCSECGKEIGKREIIET